MSAAAVDHVSHRNNKLYSRPCDDRHAGRGCWISCDIFLAYAISRPWRRWCVFDEVGHVGRAPGFARGYRSHTSVLRSHRLRSMRTLLAGADLLVPTGNPVRHRALEKGPLRRRLFDSTLCVRLRSCALHTLPTDGRRLSRAVPRLWSERLRSSLCV